MNVRKEGLATVLVQAIDEALQPLRDCIKESHARMSAVEAGIRAAAASQEARSRRISELKRAVSVSTVDSDATAIGRDS